MNSCIRPSQREVMELQRRCREECQPYIDLMVREISMDTRTVWVFRKDGTLDQIKRQETPTMTYLLAVVDNIVKRYAALALGEDPSAQNTVKPENM